MLFKYTHTHTQVFLSCNFYDSLESFFANTGELIPKGKMITAKIMKCEYKLKYGCHLLSIYCLLHILTLFSKWLYVTFLCVTDEKLRLRDFKQVLEIYQNKHSHFQLSKWPFGFKNSFFSANTFWELSCPKGPKTPLQFTKSLWGVCVFLFPQERAACASFLRIWFWDSLWDIITTS